MTSVAKLHKALSILEDLRELLSSDYPNVKNKLLTIEQELRLEQSKIKQSHRKENKDKKTAKQPNSQTAKQPKKVDSNVLVVTEEMAQKPQHAKTVGKGS